jgi:serine/threonine protein kinase, bacterial
MISISVWHSSDQPEILQTWTFQHHTRIKIGRALDNDVVLSHPLVSRYHAELIYSSDSWSLSNLSVNNTFWKGQPVQNITVQDEVVVELAPNGLNLLMCVLPDCDHSDNEPESLFCQHCGTPLQVIKQIRNYKLVQVLGKGGMGTTYQVWSADLGVQVLKEMNADVANNSKAVELFEREASMLGRLDHPGIPKFRDYFVQENNKYLVMQMIYGEDLERWVRTYGAVEPNRAIAWILQLCDILTYLHSQDPPIVHRDIKPANLIVRKTSSAIALVDFGAVKEVELVTGTRIGAPSYSAPEQNQGRPVIQSDLYAIAPTLIYLLTGRDPRTYFVDRGQGIRFYCDRIPKVSSHLAEIMTKLSDPVPTQRYLTAKDLAGELELCLLMGHG